MYITVDIDNTVANTHLELVRRFGRGGVSVKEYPAPEIPPEYFLSSEGMRLFQEVEPFPGAAGALKLFSDLGYHIAYLSSRPVNALFITTRWLKKHGFPVDQVFCGLDRNGKIDAIKNKLRAVAVFEDDPGMAKQAIANGVPALWLKDWPYNRKLPPVKVTALIAERVIRFKSWTEVQKAVVTSNPDLATQVRHEEE